MPPKPRKKAEKKIAPLDASSRYAKFPVWKINELLRFLDPSIKGLTTMNKGYKIKILSTLIRDKTMMIQPTRCFNTCVLHLNVIMDCGGVPSAHTMKKNKKNLWHTSMTMIHYTHYDKRNLTQ